MSDSLFAQNWFKENFTIGNFVVLAFVLGGFYYVTPENIDKNAQSIVSLEQKVLTNSEQIQLIQTTYLPRSEADDHVDDKEIDNLRNFFDQRMNRIEVQLDRIGDYIRRVENER